MWYQLTDADVTILKDAIEVYRRARLTLKWDILTQEEKDRIRNFDLFGASRLAHKFDSPLEKM